LQIGRRSASRQAEQARRVLLRHAIDFLRSEPFAALGQEKRAEAVRRQTVPLLAEIRREDAELGTDFPIASAKRPMRASASRVVNELPVNSMKAPSFVASCIWPPSSKSADSSRA
jgi:hypothetical protein